VAALAYGAVDIRLGRGHCEGIQHLLHQYRLVEDHWVHDITSPGYGLRSLRRMANNWRHEGQLPSPTANGAANRLQVGSLLGLACG
jgi:hypothetical protein